MTEAAYPEYDTHAAVRRFTDVGFTELQAEALVSEHVDHARQGLATKSDIQEVVHLVKEVVHQVRASEERLLARIGAVEERTKAVEERLLARIEAVEERLLARIEAGEGRLRGEIKDAKVDFLKWGVPVIVSIVAVFAAIMKLF